MHTDNGHGQIADARIVTMGQAPKSLVSHRDIRTTVLAHHAMLTVQESKLGDLQAALLAAIKALEACEAAMQEMKTKLDVQPRTFWQRLRVLAVGR